MKRILVPMSSVAGPVGREPAGVGGRSMIAGAGGAGPSPYHGALMNRPMKPATITIEGPLTGQRTVCEPILRALPKWFGLEESIVEYAVNLDTLPTFLAWDESGEVVGFMTVKQHAPQSAELYVLGVVERCHRRGIGRELLRHVETMLQQSNIRFLQVKTLSPSRPCEQYDRTRLFYESVGFTWLEEHKTLWGDANRCLQMIKSLPSSEEPFLD